VAPAHPPKPGVAYDPGAVLQISRLCCGVGLRLDGEVDLSTAGKLGQALAELAAMNGDVKLELAGLRFIDLSGATVLANFAARLGTDRRLVLQDPPVMLRRMIDLLWPQQSCMLMSPP
jgi:anti-anti-sigma factor